MTFDKMKQGTESKEGTEKNTTENPKLYSEVTRLVKNMPGGVTGLVKQFHDKGLGNIASSLTGTNGAPTITPEQIVQGLGNEKVNALAASSGLDVKVVRQELVTILPRVVQQLAPAEQVLEVR